MSETLVFNRFLFMSLSYVSSVDDHSSPAIRETVIFNDGTVEIRESESGSEDWELKESIKADPYEIGLLYDNIQGILDSDRYDKVSLDTSDIMFRIIYSPKHQETCSPLLSDDNGISIISVIEGFLAFARKEHTYYNWYSVAFNSFDDRGYSYFYDDDSIKIGDKVIVPVGKDNKEKMGTVINFWRLSEERLPYPAAKTKRIIRKVEPPKPFSVDHFLKTVEFTVRTDFEFTDVDGDKQYGNIYGDYREDEDAKEPYLKCFLSGGVAVDFVESRIAEITKV